MHASGRIWAKDSHSPDKIQVTTTLNWGLKRKNLAYFEFVSILVSPSSCTRPAIKEQPLVVLDSDNALDVKILGSPPHRLTTRFSMPLPPKPLSKPTKSIVCHGIWHLQQHGNSNAGPSCSSCSQGCSVHYSRNECKNLLKKV